MGAEAQAEQFRQFDALYDRYVKPLEQEHWREYVAVSSDDRFVLASTLVGAMTNAEESLPSDNVLFNVGEVDVDVWR